MHAHDALSLAMLALNTLTDPAAASPGDLDALDARADEAVAVLAGLRETLAGSTTAEVRAVFTRGDAGWTHPDHLAGVTVSTYYGQRDGVPVVQVDTGDVERVRINLNDGPVWDGLHTFAPAPGRYFTA